MIKINKKHILITSVILLLPLLILFIYLLNSSKKEFYNITKLSEKEISGLTLMREEEKLARDVYIALGDKWNINVFKNIQQAEQKHTDEVKNILERYEIKYSANDEMGVFESTTLKGIYDNLLDKGSKTMIDALIVGATVEDLDINDLNNLIKETDNVELLNLYNNLRSGSIKHLNSFIKQIEKNNSKYTPQYISQEEFDNIVIR